MPRLKFLHRILPERLLRKYVSYEFQKRKLNNKGETIDGEQEISEANKGASVKLNVHSIVRY